jgi:hypothetical protein
MWLVALFAVPFGIGLALLIDHRRFSRDLGLATGRVLAVQGIERKTLLNTQTPSGRSTPLMYTLWLTRFEFTARGKR